MSRRFDVKQAIRTKIYPKVGIFSPSGAGKTYSSLRMATGMIEELENIYGKKFQIWLANNEGDRGSYYSDEFKYKIIELESPHEPEMYYDLIEYAEESEECGILIIDSLSKEWAGEGGCLEIAQKLGGQYQTAWKNVTPRHRRLMDKIVDSKLAIIASMRGEDQYVMEQDEQTKKTTVSKVGLGAKQGKDFEYEFTVTFSLEQKTNTAETFKDNTHIFENRPPFKITEDDGIKLIKWANSSQIESTRVDNKKKNEQENSTKPNDALSTKIEEVKTTIQDLKDKGVEKEAIEPVIKGICVIDGKATANYNKIKDIEMANALIDALKKIEVK